MTASRPSAARSRAIRLPSPDDDAGMMAFALLAVLVGALLGGLMLPMIITQNKATRFDITRVHALHAAQAGIDVALGRIRASTQTSPTGNVAGSSAGLPCYDKKSPLVGSAAGTGSAAYSVSVTYWVTNPSAAGGKPMVCSPGYGTYDELTKTVTPRFAVVTSTGTDGLRDSGSRGRTVVSTYSFQTDDVNISGGVIRIYPDGSGNSWCMDAGSRPATGTEVVLQACSTTTPPATQQVFSYRDNLSIQLVSSVTQDDPSGLCLDTLPTLPASRSTGDRVVLNKCLGDADPAFYRQQWSIDDNSRLAGARPDQSDIDPSFCIHAPTQAAGTLLDLQGCGDGYTYQSSNLTWIPSPTAGAGMAGAVNHQLVNFQMFATCLDVTNQDPNYEYLMAYTCKQSPNPDKVTWNQKFTPNPALTDAPTNTLLETRPPGATYCLTSPLTKGGLVRVKTPCPDDASAAGPYRWTVYQTQDADGNELPYAKKYTVVDASGLCLGLGPTSNMAGEYYKITVSTCNGSTAQKWNAGTSLNTATMSNTHERVPTAP